MSAEDKIKEEAKFVGNTVFPMFMMSLLFAIILATCSVNLHDPTWKGQNDASRSESSQSATK